MECTQRLECTQELYETNSERICPEQIGFLGICGTKHPVLSGPNKIGRDPQTCSIVINLNSVSRQHAVINVLNSREYMLMDLDSANKTKLLNKTLLPYIPHPLRNGDTVQFGDIFGIFRLLEEDNELPMTQAIDIPETPVHSRPMLKLNKAPTTIIPESPDVSDRDDSFLTPSKQKGEMSRLSNSQFIKPFGKTISIQPMSSPKSGSNRNSSKRSTSSSFIDNPNNSLNESFVSSKSDKVATNNKHKMDTAPNLVANDSTDSIYTADTQIPLECAPSLSIHTLNTQLPEPTTDHLPQVCKIDDQHEIQFHIYAANKENDLSIFNAETQPFAYENTDLKEIIHKNNLKDNTITDLPRSVTKNCENTSEEELLFDEIDGECFEEDFNSQKILPDELPLQEATVKKIKAKESNRISSNRDTRIQSDDSTDCEDIDISLTQKIPELSTIENKPQENVKANNNTKASKRTERIKSDSSTDCEDIELMPTQKIPKLPTKEGIMKQKEVDKTSSRHSSKRLNRIKSDSSTDCEDIDLIPAQKIPVNKVEDDDVTDCEEEVIEIKTDKPNPPLKNVEVTKFEDMPTQIIDVDHYQNDKLSFEDMPTQIIDIDHCRTDKPAFEDMPTQVIDCDDVPTTSKNSAFEDQSKQIIDEAVTKNIERVKGSVCEIINPFKKPLQSSIRVKSKDCLKLTPKETTIKSKLTEDEDNYYQATQDIYDDLCSQKETSLDVSRITAKMEDAVVSCSVDDKVGDKFACINRKLNSTKNYDDETIKNFVKNLSSQQVRDVIGADVPVSKLKRLPSDSSDVESTPKKQLPLLFTDSDLPNSQEIKTSMMLHTRSAVTESSSESETENNSEEQFTPFLHRKKKIKPAAKIDLTKKFEIENLPERVITRLRKPPSKLLDSLEVKKQSTSILKPTYLLEQEDQIDQDIITENIKRLKTYGKAKNYRDSKNDESAIDDKKESTSRKKTDSKAIEPKDKIKVKIVKPKRKETNKNTKPTSELSAQKNDKGDNNKIMEDSLNSTSTSVAKRTRGKKKENVRKTTEKKSVSPENNKKEPENKRNRTSKRNENSKSPELEIRRSKRQQSAKENNDDDTLKAPKSILKKSIHENSTVYNISSSSTESPRSLKRSLVDDSDLPVPKRTRSVINNSNNSSGINNASLRATPARVLKTQHVLFTAFPSEEVKQKLEKLGAVIVTDVLECTVVLTVQVKRTFKLLCALGLGRPIVGPGWVQACVDTHMIVDPWLYLVKDEMAEKRFQFNLERTLTSKRNFLKGYNVSSTPSVQPNASEMKLIVECSGGTWKEGGSNWVCVSSTKDKGLWPSLRKRGATIVSTEFILGGVLRQKLDIATNKFH